MTTRAEAEAVERFGPRYRLCCAPPMVAAELDALGTDYGSSGYTTREHADDLVARLGLGPDDRVADIGAGSGWPGLYLAAMTGCRVVGTDLPMDGLLRARERLAADGLEGRASYAMATGHKQPFRPSSFDAVIHTDVLCCLMPKLSVLRACRELLRPGGRLAFTTIYARPGLDPASRRRAHRAGPVHIAARRPYPELIAQAGFTEHVEVDLTPDFERTHRAWFEAIEERRGDLERIAGRQVVAEGQTSRRAALTAIADGLLGRSLFLAVRS